MKVSARDVALVIVSAAIGAGLGLLLRLPKVPDENNLLGLIGSLIGAAIAVIAGLIVLARQFERADERHLRTVKQLLAVLKISGMTLRTADARLNPPKHINRALSALQAARSVTRELQANGPHIARVAEILDDSEAGGHLRRLSQPGIGIADPDLSACGESTVGLAERALTMLKDGL
jgi:uncharacterized membrane protein YccC